MTLTKYLLEMIKNAKIYNSADAFVLTLTHPNKIALTTHAIAFIWIIVRFSLGIFCKKIII